MSSSGFHKKFKEVMRVSPLQDGMVQPVLAGFRDCPHPGIEAKKPA